MADCTVEQVYDHTRSKLNDVLRDGGEVYTNDRLRRPFVQAWEELMQQMDSSQIPAIEKTAYFVVPAYTSELHPLLYGLSDFGEIQPPVQERAAMSTRSISGATATSPIVLTVDTSGLLSNQVVIISGVLGQAGANGRFFISVDDSNHVTLRGSRSIGDYLSGGTLCIDDGGWQEVKEYDELPQMEVGERLTAFAFNGGRFEFIGCTRDTQLKVHYISSGAAPETGYVGVDLSLNYLAARTASFATIGESRTKDAGLTLGQEAMSHLDSLLASMVRDRQRAPSQKKMYGDRRATAGFPYVRVTS